MKTSTAFKKEILCGKYDNRLNEIYLKDDIGIQKERYVKLLNDFENLFGVKDDVSFFSAPGRTEVGGNHTDHNHGRVLAAGINLDAIAVVSINDSNIIRIKSEGHEMDTVDISDLSVNESETGRSSALIRGVCARLKELGYTVGGFDSTTTSQVLTGSGMSSSAAFEVLVGTIINYMYNDGKIDAVTIAQTGQFSENKYFGKPCGLMDQTACSVGGFVTIDFNDPSSPVIEKIDFDFGSCGHALCIVDTGGSHSDLTDEYAGVRKEMESVAKFFGKDVLRDVDEEEFENNIGILRGKVGDRAVLRAMHFFADNKRVLKEVEALKDGDFETFKSYVIKSGYSSFMYNQNVYSSKNPKEQSVSVALSLSEEILSENGAWRVHGGGFAGTIQSFVPNDILHTYIEKMEKVFGKGNCHVLAIRAFGGIRVF